MLMSTADISFGFDVFAGSENPEFIVIPIFPFCVCWYLVLYV